MRVPVADCSFHLAVFQLDLISPVDNDPVHSPMLDFFFLQKGPRCHAIGAARIKYSSQRGMK